MYDGVAWSGGGHFRVDAVDAAPLRTDSLEVDGVAEREVDVLDAPKNVTVVGYDGGSGARLMQWDAPKNVTARYAAAGSSLWLLSAGWWDGSILATAVWPPASGPAVRCAVPGWGSSRAVATCLAAHTPSSTLVAGYRDGILAVFGLESKSGSSGEAPAGLALQFILAGHMETVQCVAVQPELDMVVSGSVDGQCLVHALSTGNLVCILPLAAHLGAALREGTALAVRHVAVASDGTIAVQ
ncbi:hypothetical protein CYMTET_34833, partial [Cymbomonas tetramitiformis]